MQMRSLCSSLVLLQLWVGVLLQLWVGKLPLLHWWHTMQSSHHQEPAARRQQTAFPSASLLKHKAALPQLMQLLGTGPAARLLQVVPPRNSLLKCKAALLQPPLPAAGAPPSSAPLPQLQGRPACPLMAARPPCSPIAAHWEAISVDPGGCLPSV